MLNFFKSKPGKGGKKIEVGWLLDSDKATFIWDAPRRLLPENVEKRHAKALYNCPAIIDHEGRLFEITCPIDLHLRFGVDEKTKQPVVSNPLGDMSSIRNKHLSQMLSVVSPKEWRYPNRPVVQVITPYVFVADDTVYLTQLPPFAHYRKESWPGVMIGGRFPLHIWPRTMMWAFEWHDTSRDLVVQRGEPWFYVRFEAEDPARQVRLVEAQMTPQLREYKQGLSSVTNYVSQTYSLFNTARQRRPKNLLVRKQT
jgi:hypothetical protein